MLYDMIRKWMGMMPLYDWDYLWRCNLSDDSLHKFLVFLCILVCDNLSTELWCVFLSKEKLSGYDQIEQAPIHLCCGKSGIVLKNSQEHDQDFLLLQNLVDGKNNTPWKVLQSCLDCDSQNSLGGCAPPSKGKIRD